jgi:hypothetical protein
MTKNFVLNFGHLYLFRASACPGAKAESWQ